MSCTSSSAEKLKKPFRKQCFWLDDQLSLQIQSVHIEISKLTIDRDLSMERHASETTQMSEDLG